VQAGPDRVLRRQRLPFVVDVRFHGNRLVPRQLRRGRDVRNGSGTMRAAIPRRASRWRLVAGTTPVAGQRCWGHRQRRARRRQRRRNRRCSRCAKRWRRLPSDRRRYVAGARGCTLGLARRPERAPAPVSGPGPQFRVG
jgi:hypothetical protein